MDLPVTSYARSGDVNIAYQVFGQGDHYLLFIPGWVSNIEEAWNIPQLAAWLRYLAAFTRVVIFDKRGTGLSDRVNENQLPDQEKRMEDLFAIVQNTGIEKTILLGLSEGGPLALLFAATYPELVEKVILFGSFSKWIKDDDYPFGLSESQHLKIKDHIFNHWGKPVGLHLMAPSAKDDKLAQEQWATFLRRSVSPASAKAFYEMNVKIDVRSRLQDVSCPVLIIHRKQDMLINSDHSKYLHERLPDSRLILTEGQDHLPWFGWNSGEFNAILSFIHGDGMYENPNVKGFQPGDILLFYQIKDYLENNFRHEISITSLSRQFGLNEFKLKQGFRTLFNMPPIRYLTEVRMQQAKELLSSPDETVASVAEKSGYSHANNFSNSFKKRYGVSPNTYRRSLMKK